MNTPEYHATRTAGVRREWRAHWKVVLAGAVGTCLPTIHVYSLGVFIAPLEQAFGWSRAEISTGILIYAITALVMTPVSGMACDRFGARRVAIAGAIAYCGAVATVSLATSDLRSWWAVWLLLSLVQAFVSGTVWVSAVVSFFSLGRGFAIAVCLSGTGVAAAIMPGLANMLIERFGWHGAYQGLALFWLVVTLPVLLLFFTSAKDAARSPQTTATAPVVLAGTPRREALRDSTFLRISFGTFLVASTAVPIAINIVPILQGNDLARETAVAIAGMVGVGSVVGRLGTGFLLDRFNSAVVGAFCVLIPVFGCALLLFLPHVATAAFVAAFIIGLSLGSELDVAAYMIGQYFGLHSFGAIFGVIAGTVTLAAGAGPTVVNFLYDQLGSYRPFLWACMPICLLSSILFLSLRSESRRLSNPAH